MNYYSLVLLICLWFHGRYAAVYRKYDIPHNITLALRQGVEQVAGLLTGSNVTNTAKSVHRPNAFEGGPCLACLIMLEYEQNKVKDYDAAMTVMQTIMHGCIALGIEAPKVCAGGINIFGPEVAKVILQIKIPPKELCSRAFPEKCASFEDNLATPKWSIRLPPLPTPSANSVLRNRSETRKVLQLSDLHLDLKYLPRGDAQCSEPMCCRKPIEDLNRNNRIIQYVHSSWPWSKKYVEKILPIQHSAVKVAKRQGAGVWGDYRNCDLPWWTYEHLLHTLSGKSVTYKSHTSRTLQNATNFEYIMWTGDGVAHNVWDSSKNEVMSSSRFITSSLLHHFPKTPIIPVIGNHDAFPSNNFPPSDIKDGGNITWLYEEYAEQWKHWLDEPALKTLKLGGFFTMRLNSGLRIISLNTNFCYYLNWWILLEDKDPEGMLRWMVDVLTEAEQLGENVHIIGHVPPGRKPDCIQTWSSNYYKIIQRFQNTISGQFFGHTHFDEFQIFYNDQGFPMSVGYLGPSVTPFSQTNPAYRVYDVEFPTGKVVDHSTYMFDLAVANTPDSITGKVGIPKWIFEYSAKSSYNMTSLSAHEWNKLLQFWRQEYFVHGRVPATLHEYLKLYSKQRWDGIFDEGDSFNSDKPCTNKVCVRRLLCDIAKNVEWEECHKN